MLTQDLIGQGGKKALMRTNKANGASHSKMQENQVFYNSSDVTEGQWLVSNDFKCDSLVQHSLI